MHYNMFSGRFNLLAHRHGGVDSKASCRVNPRCDDVRVIWFFFFFQAEDGIRDTSVTGVQTCALPIFPGRPAARPACGVAGGSLSYGTAVALSAVAALTAGAAVAAPRPLAAVRGKTKIGRASCRERV